MMILAIVGGPVAMLFPTSYMTLASEGLTGAGLAYLGAIGVTLIYVLVFTKIVRKIQEFGVLVMNRRLVGVLLTSLNKTMFLFGIVLSALGVGMGLFLPQFMVGC